jgi:hypothetical protein
MDKNKQFPIHFEGNGIVIFSNGSGEIFVQAEENGAEMRMSASRDGIEFTAFGGQTVEPIVVANSIGWRVSKKKAPVPRR